jgi:hypothetical protein
LVLFCVSVESNIIEGLLFVFVVDRNITPEYRSGITGVLYLAPVIKDGLIILKIRVIAVTLLLSNYFKFLQSLFVSTHLICNK